MATTIEALELQITDDSSSASSSLDKLSESLGRLKTATSGATGNMTRTANQITKLSTALSSLSGNQIRKLSDLANALRQLNSVSSLKLSSTISSRITELATALNSMDSSGASKMTSLARGINDISTASQNTKSLGTVVKNITNLAKAADDMKKMDFSNFEKLAKSLSSVVNGMNGVSSAARVTTSNINTLTRATNNYSSSNTKAKRSLTDLVAGFGGADVMARRLAGVMSKWLTESNKYQEDLNLFTASMGEYADSAMEYANKVSEVIGLDPADWMRNQGVFNTIITGFGVAGDKAALMSQQLTQLGYDISSFYNTDVETAMQKLQSGISGELEPLRRLGYDLSVARLQEEALTLGITKKVSAMSQAEKSMLRYRAIMTQVTTAQGDMARTLDTPANQLRIFSAQVTQLSRALGNLLIPVLIKVLPYITAVVRALRELVQMVAEFFGFKLTEIDYGSGSAASAADSTGDIADNLSDANSKAKKLKQHLLGIDELNIISKDDDSSGSGKGATGGGVGALDIPIPQYDFLEGAVDSLANQIYAKLEPVLDWIKKNFNEILATVSTIGAALLAWKIAKGIADFIDKLSKLSGFNLKGFIDPTFLAGLGAAASSFGAFYNAIRELQDEGATFSNVLQIIGTFTSGVGGFLATLGNTKVGGALLVIGGIAQIVAQIKEISEEGANFDNVTDLIVGIGTVMTGLLFFTGNGQWAGITVGITSAVQIIQFFHDNWEEIKNMEWGEVEWSQLILPAVGFVFGVASVFSTLKGLKKTTDTASTVTESINTATSSIGEVGDAIGGGEAGGGLTSKLTSLVKNLALGLVIIVEVAAAALLIVGAIILLGMELEQVGIAWQPVIDNGATVLTALGLGTALLVAVGVATGLLGTLGTPMIVQIALGTAILLELGAATLLFLAEVWAIGKALDQVGQAWQPVLDNAGTIITAIATSTALLIAIGVVTAALGVATVASAGLLPLAIGLGTALLVELTTSLLLFIEEVGSIATAFTNLSPKLETLNDKLPGLKDNMHNFTEYMKAFANEVVSYTKSSAISGLATTIGNIIDFFTEDPLESLADDVEKISGQTKTLNEKLKVAVPELEKAEGLLKDYKKFTQSISGMDLSVSLTQPLTSNLKEVGEAIVTGFETGIKNKQGNLQTTIKTMGTNVSKYFTDNAYGAVNKVKFESYAKNVIDGFKTKISNDTSIKSAMKTLGSSVKTNFEKPDGKTTLKSSFETIGANVIQGFINGVNSLWTTAVNTIKKFAKDIIDSAKKELDVHSPSRKFGEIGAFVVEGFNVGIVDNMSSTLSVMSDWADKITNVAPALAMGVDTSSLDSVDYSSISKDMYTEVKSSWNTNIASDGMESALDKFYSERIEPKFNSLVNNMQRQADKSETVNVQVGNRTVTDAVVTQQQANGYRFVTT